MIERLTPEQTARMPEFVEKWVGIGLSTERIDRSTVDEAIDMLYECGGLKPPTYRLYFDSPIGCMAGYSLLKASEGKIITEIEEKIKDPNNFQYSSDFFSYVCYGNQDVWLSFYDYLERVLGLSFPTLRGLFMMAEATHWFLPTMDAILISERPTLIKRDERKRLHSENGPAITYADGFGVHAWHGVRIPGEWVTVPGAITPEMALTWRNIEQRRVACEILGWDNVVKTLPVTYIDVNPDPQIGTLMDVDIPGIGVERFLRVYCPTGRYMSLPVPPEMKTALQANANSYWMTPEEFKPEVRT